MTVIRSYVTFCRSEYGYVYFLILKSAQPKLCYVLGLFVDYTLELIPDFHLLCLLLLQSEIKLLSMLIHVAFKLKQKNHSSACLSRNSLEGGTGKEWRQEEESKRMINKRVSRSHHSIIHTK